MAPNLIGSAGPVIQTRSVSMERRSSAVQRAANEPAFIRESCCIASTVIPGQPVYMISPESIVQSALQATCARTKFERVTATSATPLRCVDTGLSEQPVKIRAVTLTANTGFVWGLAAFAIRVASMADARSAAGYATPASTTCCAHTARTAPPRISANSMGFGLANARCVHRPKSANTE
mmetsp:Transcript_19108/g.29889  ORF Transcript_19108/g.29889 Transcript_19108/m.29889 type:complete len:179 (-) Transcript_19108:2241-2777(-)